MYPSGELTKLALRKSILQARIAVRRQQAAAAARELARPIAWVDRGLDTWHRFAPLIKVLGIPAGLLLVRKFTHREPKRREKLPERKKRGKIAALLSALPVILRGARMVMALRSTQTPQKPPRPMARR